MDRNWIVCLKNEHFFLLVILLRDVSIFFLFLKGGDICFFVEKQF